MPWKHRTRTDEAHVALQDIRQLRQLVQAPLSQQPPHPCDARFIGGHVAAESLLRHSRLHRAELPHAEEPSTLSYPLLSKEDRSLGVAANHEGNRAEWDSQENEPTKTQRDVQQTLGAAADRELNASLPVRIWVPSIHGKCNCTTCWTERKGISAAWHGRLGVGLSALDNPRVPVYIRPRTIQNGGTGGLRSLREGIATRARTPDHGLRSRSEGKIPLWVIPLVLAILCFPLKGVVTSPDSSWYLASALNLRNGQGYVDDQGEPIVTRGPVFSALLALSLWGFGTSVEHAFWVVRLFFVANAVLTYFFGRALYGRVVGLAGSLIYLTSFAAHSLSSYILLDGVFAFFLLLAILAISEAFKRSSLIWFAFAGFTLGVAYLTKETAIALFPLPIAALLFIGDYRDKRRLQGLCLAIGVLLFTVAPWVGYVCHVTGDPLWLFGNGSPWAMRALLVTEDPASGFSFLSMLKGFWAGCVDFFHSYVVKGFAIAWLFLWSWAFLALRSAWRRRGNDLVLIFAFLLLMPMAVIQARSELRPGQSFTLYLLTFIAAAEALAFAAAAVGDGAARFRSIRRRSGAVARCAIIALTAGVLVAQIIGDGQMVRIVSGEPIGTVYGMSMFSSGGWELPSTTRGWHNAVVSEAGEWIRSNVPSGSTLLSDTYWRSSLYYYSNGDYTFLDIPYVDSWQQQTMMRAATKVTEGRAAPVLLWRDWNNSPSDWYLRALCETDLFDQIAANDAGFVVATARRSFLSVYLDANPGFESVATIGSGAIRIYAIQDAAPADSYPLHVDRRVPATLGQLRTADPDEYARVANDFLVQQLGLSNEEILRIESGAFPVFDTGF